jgi:hypothetical protein
MQTGDPASVIAEKKAKATSGVAAPDVAVNVKIPASCSI